MSIKFTFLCLIRKLILSPIIELFSFEIYFSQLLIFTNIHTIFHRTKTGKFMIQNTNCYYKPLQICFKHFLHNIPLRQFIKYTFITREI